jgi:integrase
VKLDKIDGKANSSLYRHPKTGIIYLCMSKVGKGRIQRSTGTDNLSEARRIADEIKFKFLGKRNPNHGRKLNKELFAEFLQTKEIKAPSTYARIKLCWERLKYFLEDVGPEDITEQWWLGIYIPLKRAEPDGKKQKFFNDRKVLRMYLLSLHRQGIIDRIPNLINPDPETKAGKVFTDDEIERLLKEASNDLKLQILMAYTMGMRKGEILLLALDRIDQRRKLISLNSEDTKTRKARTFAISDVVWPLIEVRLGHPSGYLFPSNTGEGRPVDKGGNQSAWEGAKSRCRPKVTGRFHDIRHSFLTKAFKTPGANAALICFYAGLSLEVAEKVYLHFDAEDAREISNLVRIR